ncbi:MAG: Fic family protein [Sphingomonadales bacterium]|nr:Fic family protein [Sphingomonadales bacterium]
MDPSRFTKPSGSLVSINEKGDVAFIPAPLPTKMQVPASLTHLWVAAREAVGELRGIGRTLPNHALLARPMRQREALRSSSLEGTYATPAELLAYERDPRDPYSSKDPANVWREVFNYQKALDIGYDLIREGYPFSEWLLRQLHENLLEGVRGDDKNPGEIRKTQVHIGAGNRFTPPPAEHLSALMGQLEKDIQAKPDIDPLIWAFLIHYQFETIHPFRDGNGRVGRLLLALMIYKNCNFDMPWLYLSEFFEKHKDEYIDSLFNISSESDWEGWIKFCLIATIEVGKGTIERIGKLLALKQEYEDKIKKRKGHDRLIHVIPKLFSSPIIGYEDIKKELGVSYPTARSDMDALVEMGIVSALPASKNPKYFGAKEIFNIAYYDQVD